MIVNLLFSYFKPSQSKYSLGNKSKLTILCNYMNILRGDKAYTPIAPAISFKLNYKSLWKSNSYYNHFNKKKFYSENFYGIITKPGFFTTLALHGRTFNFSNSFPAKCRKMKALSFSSEE